MGKIIVSSCVSIDGYTEGPGGDVSAMPLDETFNDHNAELIRAAGRLLYGATNYRNMLAFWPDELTNPDASSSSRYIARRLADGMPVVVVSDSLTPDDTGAWREQTTIVRRADAHAAVAELRAEAGDTVIFGSRILCADLLAHGLVDELYVILGPKIVAGDHHAFDGVPPTDLRLLDLHRPEGSDNVVLHYELIAVAAGRTKAPATPGPGTAHGAM